MTIYNLFESVILEEVAKQVKLLTEGVSLDVVNKAIDDMCNVNITYDDYPDANPPVPPSKRYIQIYNQGNTKANNGAIRAFQIFGGSKTTPKNGAWKTFRLDRIRSWQQTKMKFNSPISDKDKSIPTYQPDHDNKMMNNQPNKKVEFKVK